MYDRDFICWFAGMIDGEGHFGIYNKSVRVTVSNNCRQALDEIEDKTGWGRVRARSNQRDGYWWEGGANACRDLLPHLIPHLRIKRELAELLYSYLTEGSFTNKPPPKNEIQRRATIIKRVRAINVSRGRIARV